jgi:hypothetical protein
VEREGEAMNPNGSKRGIALVIGLAATLLIADAWVPGIRSVRPRP